MREFANLSIKLMIICAIAGAALGFTNIVTKDRIKEQTAMEANQARRDIIPDATEFVPIEGITLPEGVTDIYTAKKGDELLGYTVGVRVGGYKAGIEMNVGIGTDGKLLGIRIGANEETPGLGAKIKEEAFYAQFAGADSSKIAVQKDGGDIVAVSAATISSRAVCKGVNAAQEVIKDIAQGGDINE